MKSVNEQVAEVMGWELLDESNGEFSHKYWADEHGSYLCESDELNFDNTITGNWLSKAIQQRMRSDGWHVHLIFVEGQPVQAEAFHRKYGKRLSQDKNEEPAALVDLFCKCNGIKGE